MKTKLTLSFLFFGSLLAAQTGASNDGLRDLTCPSISSGSTTAYACNSAVATVAYVSNATYGFKSDTTNSGAATFSLNGIGAKTIVKLAGAPNTALVAGDIRTGQEVVLKYDGTNMQMISPLGNASSAGGCVTSGTNLQNGDGTGGCADSGIASSDVNRLGTAQTITATKTISANGAASTPVLGLTGTLFVGGSGTTTMPMIFPDQGVTKPTTWSTGGTYFGVNAASTFTGNYIDLRLNGGSCLFCVNSSGTVILSNSAPYSWVNGTRVFSPSIGILELTSSSSSFTRMQFVGTTDSTPALCISGTTVSVCGGAGGAGVGTFISPAFAARPTVTASLPTCTATTGTPWRASVTDATAPAIGVVLTGGGAVFANVHCSLTTGTYLVDGI